MCSRCHAVGSRPRTSSREERSRVRVGCLIQACQRHLLRGDLWNAALSEMLREAPALVLWWRAAAVGTHVLLSARNAHLLATWFERERDDQSDSSGSGAGTGAGADADREKQELARLHAAAGLGGARAHPNDRALERAERALGFPVCALELDAPPTNAHRTAAVYEAERLLTAILVLESWYLDECRRSPALRWALQYASTLLARAHLMPALEHHLSASSNMEALGSALELLQVCIV